MILKKEHLKKGKVLIYLATALTIINLCFVSAYIVVAQFGTVTLSPGERYTLNIPFIHITNQTSGQDPGSPIICGRASLTNGTAVTNVTVTIKYENNSSIVAVNTTRNDGRFCVTLPSITSSTEQFDIFIEYNNSTIILASNDYDLNFDNYKIYNRSTAKYAVLSGSISNEYAEIENGRLEINLKYNETGRFTYSREIFDYQKYLINISANSNRSFPNSMMNISWPINSSTAIGVYKFYIKPSFNGLEKTPVNIYFNVTG